MSIPPIDYSLIFREPTKLQGALINGLESRVSQIEQKLSDLDARGSEEHDNLANERELHRFIMTGDSSTIFLLLSLLHSLIAYRCL